MNASSDMPSLEGLQAENAELRLRLQEVELRQHVVLGSIAGGSRHALEPIRRALDALRRACATEQQALTALAVVDHEIVQLTRLIDNPASPASASRQVPLAGGSAEGDAREPDARPSEMTESRQAVSTEDSGVPNSNRDTALRTVPKVPLRSAARALLHELAQPLNTIACYAVAARNLAGKAEIDVPALRAALQSVAQEVPRAGAIVDNLRTLFQEMQVGETPGSRDPG